MSVWSKMAINFGRHLWVFPYFLGHCEKKNIQLGLTFTQLFTICEVDSINSNAVQLDLVTLNLK